MRALLLTLIAVFSSAVFGEEVALFHQQLSPQKTNAAIVQVGGPHQVFYPSTEASRGLLVTLSGTGRTPIEMSKLGETAAALNYDVISLDYPNKISTPTCGKSLNPLCFDQFRSVISLGQGQSELISVNTLNSIVNRLKSALATLALENRRWENYLNQDQINWDELTLLGHSQGAGHAAFLAKHHRVKRVVMLGGPQDQFEVGSNAAAPWLQASGVTPAERYFALLHRQDYFNKNLKQVSAFRTLGGMESHLILSDKPAHDAHQDLVKEQFVPEWRDLFSR